MLAGTRPVRRAAGDVRVRAVAAALLAALVALAVVRLIGMITALPQTVFSSDVVSKQLAAAPTAAARASMVQSVFALIGALATASVALTAAAATAIVAILTFAFTYRAGLRTQRDAQFFEALKRFGDENSPRLRAGAALQLAQMGRAYEPYRPVAIGQLLSGSVLEEVSAVLDAIRDGLRIVPLDTREPVLDLYRVNIGLQRSLLEALAAFSAYYAPADPPASPKTMADAAVSTDYDALVLQTLVSRAAGAAAVPFDEIRAAAAADFALVGANEKDNRIAAARRELTLRSKRLRCNVDALSTALKCRRPQRRVVPDRIVTGLWRRSWYTVARFVMSHAALRSMPAAVPRLAGVFLCGASLSGANLRYVELPGAQLQHATLDDADLTSSVLHSAALQYAQLSYTNFDHSRGTAANFDSSLLSFARLGTAEFDGASFSATTWWLANFDDPSTGVLDRTLGADARKGRHTAAEGARLVLRLCADPVAPKPNPETTAIHPSIESLVRAQLAASAAGPGAATSPGGSS